MCSGEVVFPHLSNIARLARIEARDRIRHLDRIMSTSFSPVVSQRSTSGLGSRAILSTLDNVWKSSLKCFQNRASPVHVDNLFYLYHNRGS